MLVITSLVMSLRSLGLRTTLMWSPSQCMFPVATVTMPTLQALTTQQFEDGFLAKDLNAELKNSVYVRFGATFGIPPL